MFADADTRVQQVMESSVRELSVAVHESGAQLWFAVRPHPDGRWVAASLTLAPAPSRIVGALVETALSITDVERLRAVLQQQCGRLQPAQDRASVQMLGALPVVSGVNVRDARLALAILGVTGTTDALP
jgi:hypothetical protein